MAFGNNRKGEQPRAHFQLAGGSIIKFRHPYLAGQIDTTNTAIDEIDVSACCKLDGTYFSATPNQDSAKQTVLIDGSTVTICNRLLNGTITMPVVRTTGVVGTGDFISALQLIKATGDNVGGVLTKTDYINGKAITTVYYGVTVQRVPDDISVGNEVAEYNIQLLYAGWIQAIGKASSATKAIWAVGNQQGLEAYFNPYPLQNGSTGEDATSATNVGIPATSIADATDDTTVNVDVRDNANEQKVLDDNYKAGATAIVVAGKNI